MPSEDGNLPGERKAGKSDEEHGGSSSFERAKAQQPHHSVGFWHHKMSKVRKHVIVLWIRTGTSTGQAQQYPEPAETLRPECAS